MGLGGISIWQLLIILVVVLLIFGSGKLKTLGSDLGSGLKSFKKAVKEESPAENKPAGDKQRYIEHKIPNTR